MTADEYRDALDKLGIEQDELARLLNVTTRSSRRWISGAVPVPRAVALVLRFMIRYNLPADSVWRQMLTREERRHQEESEIS
jgi:plasmid maintenance system antidote protein VapI